MASVGRKSKKDVISKNLKNIKKWASDGATEKQIANCLGLSVSSFQKYKSQMPELKETIDKGRVQLVVDLKGALVKKAKGFEYEEKKQYIKKDIETGKNTQYTEITKKHALPDVAALNLALKNYDKEWKNDPDMYDLKKQELELRKQMAEENKGW